MMYLIIYIVIAMISILAFQVALRWMQYGRLEFDDVCMSVLGGVFWPAAYIALIIMGICMGVSVGFGVLSEKIYEKLKGL